MKTLDDLNLKFSQHIGTDKYYQHWTKRGYWTQGINDMAEKFKAYWLIDVVLSYQTRRLAKYPFQIWTIKCENEKAVVEMKEDKNEPVLIKQKIPFTDFPEGILKMYYIDNILLLPSEY